jgi:Helix-hairpin-helix motif
MHFDLPKSTEEQQRDGRLTIILMLLFLFLLLLFGQHQGFCRNINKPNNKYLSVSVDKQLYLGNDEKITEFPASMPLSYYLFYFLPLPINSVDQELLMTIKGIGPAMAESIITHRKNSGSILDVGDLQAIPGIGRKRATSLATELVFDRVE